MNRYMDHSRRFEAAAAKRSTGQARGHPLHAAGSRPAAGAHAARDPGASARLRGAREPRDRRAPLPLGGDGQVTRAPPAREAAGSEPRACRGRRLPPRPDHVTSGPATLTPVSTACAEPPEGGMLLRLRNRKVCRLYQVLAVAEQAGEHGQSAAADAELQARQCEPPMRGLTARPAYTPSEGESKSFLHVFHKIHRRTTVDLSGLPTLSLTAVGVAAALVRKGYRTPGLVDRSRARPGSRHRGTTERFAPRRSPAGDRDVRVVPSDCLYRGRIRPARRFRRGSAQQSGGLPPSYLRWAVYTPCARLTGAAAGLAAVTSAR